MTLSVCVFCGSRTGSRPVYEEIARGFGAGLGRAGARMIYGGGHVGLMGAAADAAMAAGGEVIGLIPARLLELEVGHRDITELIVTGDMFERKAEMIARADAFAVLPGGLGTLDELLEVVTLKQLGYHTKPIVLVEHDSFWRHWRAMVGAIVHEGFADPGSDALYLSVDGVEAALHALGLVDGEAARTARAPSQSSIQFS